MMFLMKTSEKSHGEGMNLCTDIGASSLITILA